jgi:hypothetical protein
VYAAMKTNDNGSSPWSSGPLEDTPEMKRLLATLQSLPRDKVEHILERLVSEAAIIEAAEPPEGSGDKGE